jgi:hypothetical protein
MDAYAKSDPMVYIVCGSSAFVTDVIDNKQDAYWLPLTRRACILPVMNAHAQIYIACFDYDGEKVMDDYIGRVVLDIPQIESGYTYDVQLPLRDCSRVYNRRQLGFIRIRFSLEWNEQSGRAALLSYLPSPIDLKKRMKNEHVAVTVMCPDSKSFSNIAHTVYGKDIPGKYSNNIRACETTFCTCFDSTYDCLFPQLCSLPLNSCNKRAFPAEKDASIFYQRINRGHIHLEASLALWLHLLLVDAFCDCKLYSPCSVIFIEFISYLTVEKLYQVLHQVLPCFTIRTQGDK